jgi:hypothetical protein
MTDREKPSAGFWITVTLVAVLVGYPLSFGPACWVTSHANSGKKAVTVAYWPITWVWDRAPDPMIDVLNWYSRLGAAEGWCWRRSYFATAGGGIGSESHWSN